LKAEKLKKKEARQQKVDKRKLELALEKERQNKIVPLTQPKTDDKWTVHIKGWKDTKPQVKIPKQTPRVQPPTTVQHTDLTALQEYILEQHGVDVTTDQITQAKFPWLAFSAKGEPLLYGDAALHKKLGLPDAFRVVRSQTGILHTAYDPQKVKPKFFKVHSVGVETY
jgi:hypothetical protein